jgi:hypothetical protein
MNNVSNIVTTPHVIIKIFNTSELVLLVTTADKSKFNVDDNEYNIAPTPDTNGAVTIKNDNTIVNTLFDAFIFSSADKLDFDIAMLTVDDKELYIFKFEAEGVLILIY